MSHISVGEQPPVSVKDRLCRTIYPLRDPQIGVLMYGRSVKHNSFFLNYEDTLKMAHFKVDGSVWQDFSRDGKFYVCSYLDFLDTEEADTLIASIMSFSTNNENSAKYSVSFSNNSRVVDGVFVGGYADEGLTCSTFIICLLNNLAFQIVDTEGWPITDEDRQWQQDNKNSLDCLGTVGRTPRFTPEQVLGACCCFDGENSLKYNHVLESAKQVATLFSEHARDFDESQRNSSLNLCLPSLE